MTTAAMDTIIRIAEEHGLYAVRCVGPGGVSRIGVQVWYVSADGSEGFDWEYATNIQDLRRIIGY